MRQTTLLHLIQTDTSRKLRLGCLGSQIEKPQHLGSSACLLFRGKQGGKVNAYSWAWSQGYYTQINKGAGFMMYSWIKETHKLISVEQRLQGSRLQREESCVGHFLYTLSMSTQCKRFPKVKLWFFGSFPDPLPFFTLSFKEQNSKYLSWAHGTFQGGAQFLFSPLFHTEALALLLFSPLHKPSGGLCFATMLWELTVHPWCSQCSLHFLPTLNLIDIRNKWYFPITTTCISF